MEETLFKVSLDTKVSETFADTGFDTDPLLKTFGQDITWRDVFKINDTELLEIKGYGRQTVDCIHRFISSNCEYSFEDFLK